MAKKTETAAKHEAEIIDHETGEVLTDTDGAEPTGCGEGRSLTSSHLTSQDALNAALAKLGFKQKRAVTRPLLKFEAAPVIVEVQSHFYLGKEIPEAKYGAPLLMDVKDMLTGTDCQSIVGAVLQNELADAYGDDEAKAVFNNRKSTDADRAKIASHIDIVGRRFMIARIPVDGKRYAAYAVTELEKTGD